MRAAVIKKLEELMLTDDDIVVITGDLGFLLFDRIREKFPKRFYNAGISEQSMVGIAAGLAKEGKKVILYSIIPFLLYRPFEQILLDVCYHRLPVIFLGSGDGFSYGVEGFTHYGLNDLSLTLQIPNMRVYAPAETSEAVKFLEESLKKSEPSYIRLSKEKNPNFNKKRKNKNGFTILEESDKITVLSTGTISFNVAEAIDKLKNDGIFVGHFHIGRLKPINPNIFKMLAKTKFIITVEEHEKKCGFGSFLRNYFEQKVYTIGVDNIFVRNTGERQYILRSQKLDALGLYKRIKNLYKCLF